MRKARGKQALRPHKDDIAVQLAEVRDQRWSIRRVCRPLTTKRGPGMVPDAPKSTHFIKVACGDQSETFGHHDD